MVNGDSDLLQLSTEVLIRHGYEADAAADGAVAWKALITHQYDLLITDYQIPKLSGVRLLQKLRLASMVVPVIVATTTFPRTEATLLPWVQPTVTLLMPYTVSEFLETVQGVWRTKVKGGPETLPPAKISGGLPSDSLTQGCG